MTARAFQWGENETAEQFAERIAPLVSEAMQQGKPASDAPASDVSAGTEGIEEI